MTIKIKICKGNACKKRNSQYVMDRATDGLGLPENGGTLENGKVSVEFGGCIGKCARSVNVTIERGEGEKITKQVHSDVNPLKMGGIVKEFQNKKPKK